MRLLHVGMVVLMVGAAHGAAESSLSAELQVTLQSHPSLAGVCVDGAALVQKAGGPAPFQVESVVVRPAEGADTAPVASRADAVNGVCRVLWQVPAAATKDQAGTTGRFRLEFGSILAPTDSPRLPAGTLDSLVDNGGFERAAADGVPDGIAPAVFKRDFTWVADDGGHALALNADAEGHGPSFTTPWVAIDGGQPYTYSFRHRADKAEAHPRYKLVAYGYVNYRDAAGQLLPRASVFETRLGDSEGWKGFSATFAAPKEARWANLEFRNGSKVPGSVRLDDVRIAAATLPQLSVAQAPGGQRVSLRVEDPGIRRFDLGTPTSPVWDGFQGLTPKTEYTAASGFGFTALQQPEGIDRTRPEPLTRDFVNALRAALRVDLPDGDYMVWFLAGDAQVGSTIVWIYRDQHIRINGQDVLTRTPAPAEYFRTTYLAHYRNVWQPGMDYYDTFVAPRFEALTFPAAVVGGKLLLSWSNVPVAALVICPRRLEGEMREELTRLAADRKRATPVEAVPGPKEEPLAPSPAEAKRGFVLFRRPASDEVFPSSRPRADERIEALRCFATPGEYEPVHFSLLPLRDLGATRVTAADFTSGAQRIPASAVDVRIVRYVFQASGRGAGGYRYRVAPYFLDHRDRVDLAAEVAWSWWAVVRVPEATPAGVYDGALEITPGTGEPLRLPWSLRVLPFRLAPLPIVQGYYYFPGEPWYSAFWGANVRGPRYRDDPEIRQLIEQNERRELRFMKSLGLNSAAFGDDMRGDLELVDGKVRFKPGNRFAWWMDIYRDEGMGPMPFYGFQPLGAGNNLAWLDKEGLKEPFTPRWNTAYRSVVEEGQRLGKERGWPEILWYISDELSNHGEPGGKQGVELAKALAGIPGARLIASMNGPWEHIMVPHLTISMPNIAFPITDETVKRVREAGSELWLYNCGDERLNLGLYPWRLKAGGRFQWHFHGMNADPWDDLDGSSGDTSYCLGLPGPDETVPAIKAQIVREAIDDHRYVATLEQAIAAAKADAAKTASVAKAERFLADLRDRIPVDFRTLVGFQVDPRAAGAALGGEFKNTDALDRVRWAVAQLVVELGMTP